MNYQATSEKSTIARYAGSNFDQPDATTQHQTNLEDQKQSDAPGNQIFVISFGDIIELYCPLDNQYYPGTIASVNEDGHHVLTYAEGDDETSNMDKETWRFTVSDK